MTPSPAPNPNPAPNPAPNPNPPLTPTPTPESPASILAAMPFAARLGMELSEATAARVTGVLAWSADLCTADGALHGGALMTLADSVGAACAFLNLPEGASTSTLDSRTTFFRAVREGSARAVARPLHVGRSFIVVQTEVYDARERAVGQTTQTQAVRRDRAGR